MLWKAYTEHCQASKMICFAKIVKDYQPYTIFAKCCVLDVSQGSEYAPGFYSID